MGFVFNIILTLAVVGIIIFFHELGHFLAAKKLGIKVQRFSIGFGPKLIGFTRGETEYRISWLPLFGGYVKMLGENPAERREEEATEEEFQAEEGRFDLAPVSHRAIVAVSGPGMNVILAVITFALAYMVGLPADPDTTIGYVDPDSPAAQAGIMRGDEILSVNGYKTKVWGDIQENVITNAGEEIQVTLLRGEDQQVTLRTVPEPREMLITSLSLDLQSELDSGIISPDLWQEFEASDLSLSSDRAVSTQTAGSRWLITDEDRKYHVEKEENKLDIYLETETGKKKPAFSIRLDPRSELDIRDDLDNGVIPDVLSQKLRISNADLSPRASIAVEEPGSRWLITDKGHRKGLLRWLIPGGDRRYHVRLEEGRLDVYLETELGVLGIIHGSKPIVRALSPGSIAFEAGLREGDTIEAVNGIGVLYDIDFFTELQDASGESVALTVRRAERTVEIPVPLKSGGGNPLASFERLSFERVVHRDPITAFRMAVPETVRMGSKIFQYLKKLIIREVSPKFLAGPLGIVQITMAAVQTGLAGTLRFAGFLSVNLGIVNLLPLFITDGAMIVFLMVEKLRGKAMDPKKQLIIQQVGIVFIIFIFLFLTYNDILRWVKGPF